MQLVKKENEMFVDIVDELAASLLTKRSKETGQHVVSVSAFFDEFGHKYKKTKKYWFEVAPKKRALYGIRPHEPGMY